MISHIPQDNLGYTYLSIPQIYDKFWDIITYPFLNLWSIMSVKTCDVISPGCFITLRSHEHYGISNNWQLDCLFNRMLWLTTDETPMVYIIVTLWGGSTLHQLFPFTKCQQCRKLFSNPDVNMMASDQLGLHGNLDPDSKVYGANMGFIWGRQDNSWAPCWPGELLCGDVIKVTALSFLRVLTHWGRATYICVNKAGHRWFR